mgnify:CR=1 FL=1
MKKINLGCGWRNFGKDWIHIDGGDYPHLDSKDIFNLPYKDNTVDLIYVSHLIAYFDRDEIEDIINKWYNKLKPGGIFRVATPDFGVISELVKKGHSLENFLGPLYGKMSIEDRIIYHKTTYNFNSLKKLLIKCGFNKIKYYNWRETEHKNFDDHSQAYIPHMYKENGTLISLNIESIK